MFTENAQLFTFANIFFLPLAFCTSAWTVSGDTSPLHAPLITAILVGGTTHFTVFNLNNMAHRCRVSYHLNKVRAIDRMKEDSKFWRSRGDLFDQSTFGAKTESQKPSGWILILCLLRNFLTLLAGSIQGLFKTILSKLYRGPLLHK